MTQQELQALPPVLRDYFHYITAVKNRSKTTVREYYLDLRTFFRYLVLLRDLCPANTPFDEIPLDAVDVEFLKKVHIGEALAFLAYCKNERDNSAAARARKSVAIRQFFRYAADRMHIIPENPVSQLDTPKTKRALPKFLTLEQSISLLNAVDGPNRERNYAIITLFLNCGLRLSELCSINLSDIRTDNTLRVTGKGSKERIVYLNDACLAAIKAYLDVRPKDGLKDRQALFISRNRNRISPKTVQLIIYQALEKAGLGGFDFSVHKLRHTAATLMYQEGVDLLVLKQFLGHENINTTEIYTHLSSHQLEEAAKKNPLSKLHPPRGKPEDEDD